MSINLKTRFSIFLAVILLLQSSCLEKKPVGVKILEMSPDDICDTIDGEWAIFKIKDGKDDCREKSCRTGVGLIRFECDGTKILAEHFLGAKTISGYEQWDKVTAEIENENLSLSLKVLDKKDADTEYQVSYKVEEVRENRLFGEYEMQQVSNGRVVHKTRFIAKKKLRTWKPYKP